MTTGGPRQCFSDSESKNGLHSNRSPPLSGSLPLVVGHNVNHSNSAENIGVCAEHTYFDDDDDVKEHCGISTPPSAVLADISTIHISSENAQNTQSSNPKRTRKRKRRSSKGTPCGKRGTPNSNISRRTCSSKKKKKRRLLSETQNAKEEENGKQESTVELISEHLVADVKRVVIDHLLPSPLLLKLSLLDASWDELCVEQLKRAKWNRPTIEIARFFRNKNPFLRTFVNVEEQGNTYAKTFHDDVRLLVRKLRYLMEAKWKSEDEESPFMLESFTPYALGWLCSYCEEQLPRCPVILQEKIRDLFLRDFPRTSEYIYSPPFLKSETFIDVVASRRDVITILNLGDLELNDRSLMRLSFPNLKELIWHNADMLELATWDIPEVSVLSVTASASSMNGFDIVTVLPKLDHLYTGLKVPDDPTRFDLDVLLRSYQAFWNMPIPTRQRGEGDRGNGTEYVIASIPKVRHIAFWNAPEKLFSSMAKSNIAFETVQFGQLNQSLTRLCSLDSIMQALFKFNQPKYECFKLDITHLKFYCHAMPVVSLDYYLPQLMMGINDAMTSIHSLDLFVHCSFSASMPTSWVLEGHQKNSCSKLKNLTHFSFHIDGFCVFYDLDCHLPPSLTCVSISVTLPPVGAQRSVSSLMAFVKRLANVNAYPDLEELHLQVWGIRCAEQLLNHVADYLSDVRRLSIIAMPVSGQRERLIDLIRHVASSCPRLVSLKLSVELMLILVEEYGDLWKHNWRLAIARVAADCGMRDSCDFGVDALPHVSGCDEFIVKPTYPKDSNIELDLAGLAGIEDEEEEEGGRANYMQDSDSCSNDSFVVDNEDEGSEEDEEDEIDLLDQELESETDRRHQRYLKKKSRLPSSSSEEEQAGEDDEDGSDVEYVTDYEDEENEQQHPLIDGEAEEVESDAESEEESEREPEGDDNELSSDQGMLDREAEEVESGLESEDGSETEPEGEDAAFSSDQEMLEAAVEMVNARPRRDQGRQPRRRHLVAFSIESCITSSRALLNRGRRSLLRNHNTRMQPSKARISILLLIAYRFTLSLNPCMVDRDACLPIEDFEVNCTCILISGEPINATDEVYMYFMGHQFPFYLFSQIFREKLNLRIPAAHDFETSLDMPEAIYKNLRFEENMALFLINSSRTTDIIRMLINESYIRTRDMRENSDKWCAEGECAVFLHTEEPFNKTVGVYAQTVDLFHVVELGGRSIVAVSSVYADFEVPKVHEIVCKNKCRRFYWNEGILCRQQCSQGLRYDQVAVTGTLKRNFVNFVRAAAVQNFRAKYSKYLH